MLSKARLKKTVKKYGAVVNALKEYDITRKLKKSSYRERVNFTIDADAYIQFRKHCEKNNISISGKVESFIKEYLKYGSKTKAWFSSRFS